MSLIFLKKLTTQKEKIVKMIAILEMKKMKAILMKMKKMMKKLMMKIFLNKIWRRSLNHRGKKAEINVKDEEIR